ncbi:unnamed protein product, partial [Brassica oleracea]
DQFSTYDLWLQLEKQQLLISNVFPYDVFKCRRINELKISTVKSHNSLRAVDTAEAMSTVIVNACYRQDRTITSYLNELIRHSNLLME